MGKIRERYPYYCRMAVHAVQVHALDESAKRFYLKYGFQPFPRPAAASVSAPVHRQAALLTGKEFGLRSQIPKLRG
jgi:predicted acetyltransferase